MFVELLEPKKDLDPVPAGDCAGGGYAVFAP